MATKKKSSDTKKPKAKKGAPRPQIPAVPPPDDPLLRSTEFDADREYHTREMAEKRLKAIRQTREMPTSDESPVEPEQTASPNHSDSKDDD